MSRMSNDDLLMEDLADAFLGDEEEVAPAPKVEEEPARLEFQSPISMSAFLTTS